MYEIRVKKNFSAAHRIYQGDKCENLHGHNWQVEVCIKSGKLDEKGMVVDFRKIKENLDKILGNLDHKYLNEVLPFSPTSENIACYIFKQLNKNIDKKNYFFSAVSVKENEDTQAIYCK